MFALSEDLMLTLKNTIVQDSKLLKESNNDFCLRDGCQGCANSCTATCKYSCMHSTRLD